MLFRSATSLHLRATCPTGRAASAGSNRSVRWKWLGIVLIASAVGQVVTALAQLPERNQQNTNVTIDNLGGTLGLFLLVSLAVAAISVAALVLQVLQVLLAFRMAKNLQVLGRTGAAFSPGACIAVVILGGCTAGILPFFMWRELWAGSDPSVPAHAPNWKSAKVGDIVVANLVLSVLSTVVGLATGVGNLVARINSTTSSIFDTSGASAGWLLVSGLVTAASTVVLLLLVRQLSARHMQATREA